MAILDLDKITIKNPDSGILCNNCGGDLKPARKIKWKGKIIRFISFGAVNIRHYQCDTCKKKFVVL